MYINSRSPPYFEYHPSFHHFNTGLGRCLSRFGICYRSVRALLFWLYRWCLAWLSELFSRTFLYWVRSARRPLCQLFYWLRPARPLLCRPLSFHLQSSNSSPNTWISNWNCSRWFSISSRWASIAKLWALWIWAISLVSLLSRSVFHSSNCDLLHGDWFLQKVFALQNRTFCRYW